MRICYVCADRGIALDKYNGSASHVRSLVRSFQDLGHEVTLLLSNTQSAEELGAAVRTIRGTHSADAVLEQALSLGADRAARRSNGAVARALRHVWTNHGLEQALTDEIACRKPDLIYERHSPFSAAGALTARRLGVRHLLEVNAPLAWEGRQHRGQALSEAAQLLEQLAFQATGRIIAVSEELRRHLIQEGVDGGKIQTVPNGVDLERFSPCGEVHRNGLDGRLVVGFVGSLKAWHGLDVLADGFRSVAADRRFHLLVVGDGPMASRLHALQQELPEQVTLVGAVHPRDVPTYVRAMNIAVAPYPEQEKFYFSPLKVLEYMAAGRAVVCSRIGQLKTLIRHGETGMLVAPGNADALAGALRRLGAEEDLRARLGRQAASEAARLHSWHCRASGILGQAEAMV